MLVVVVVLLLLSFSSPGDAIPQAQHRPVQHTASSQKSLLSSIYSLVNPSASSSTTARNSRDAEPRNPTYGVRSSTYTHKKPSTAEIHPLSLLTLQSPGPVRSTLGALADDISQAMTDILSLEILPTRNQPLDLLEPHSVSKRRKEAPVDLSDRLDVSYTPSGYDLHLDAELLQTDGSNGTDNNTDDTVVLECHSDSFQSEAYRDVYLCNNESLSEEAYTERTGLFPNGTFVDPATEDCSGANQTLQDAYQDYVVGEISVPSPAPANETMVNTTAAPTALNATAAPTELSFDDWRVTVCDFNNASNATLPDGVSVPVDADALCLTYEQCEARPTCNVTEETTQFCVCPRDRRGVLCNVHTPYQCEATLTAPLPDCREGYQNYDPRLVGAAPCFFVEPEGTTSEGDETEVDASAVGLNGRFEFEHAVTCEFTGTDFQNREGPGWDLEGAGYVWNTSEVWPFNYTIGDSNSTFAWTGRGFPRMRMKIFNMNILFDDTQAHTYDLASEHIADANNSQPLGVSFQLSDLGGDYVTSGRVYAELSIVTEFDARISSVMPYHVEVLGYELPPTIPPSTLVIALTTVSSIIGAILFVTIVAVYYVRRRKRKREEQFFIEHGYFPGDRGKRTRRHGDSSSGSDDAALLGDLDADEEEAIRRRGGSEEVELEPLGSSLDSDVKDSDGDSVGLRTSGSGSAGSFRKRWSTLSMSRSHMFRVKRSSSHEDDDDDVVEADDVTEEEQLADTDAVDIALTEMD